MYLIIYIPIYYIYILHTYYIDIIYIYIHLMEYMDYTFSILQPIKLEKNRYTPSLYYFYKRSIFEALCKIN